MSNKKAMETNPLFPFETRSGWLPEFGSQSYTEFFTTLLKKKPKALHPSVKALGDTIKNDKVLLYLVESACKENGNLIAYVKKDKENDDNIPIPLIKDLDTLLHAFNHLLSVWPHYVNDDLVGLPFSAFIVGIDPTLNGSALLRLPMFNEKMSVILKEWNKFLASPASAGGFEKEGKQWLSKKAKASYQFDDWKKDQDKLPYWKSWNSFFIRQFKNPAKQRPIAGPNTNKVVISPNDGSLYKWRPNLVKTDVFWFKNMAYSLSDILSSSDPVQQKIIDKHKLVDLFKGGYIFQTYLNPYNYHRWWVPVNGKVLFDPIVIPGCFFSKLILPDFGGATTDSTPYLSEVNARGLIVFKTEDYGHVCCLPLGMSEVSSVEFNSKMKAGATVKKGQEMGNFNYGGSSFAVIYEKLPNKVLYFVNSDGVPYDQDPPPAASSASTGGEPTNIGAQIGVWVDTK